MSTTALPMRAGVLQAALEVIRADRLGESAFESGITEKKLRHEIRFSEWERDSGQVGYGDGYNYLPPSFRRRWVDSRQLGWSHQS